jgi:saccharopine dehydrogenase-like NADP-dependent oxidoreductase
MRDVLVLGAGKIGALISGLLAESGDYRVLLGDSKPGEADHVASAHGSDAVSACELDASDADALTRHLREHKPAAIVSSLPFFCNVTVAEVAREAGVHYFDLTEDVAVTAKVRELATGADKAFVPQCGLAPGFISIAANELIQHFDTLRSVKLRVGALPQHPNNVLKYSLTWSTDGLINEYCNPCEAIHNNRRIDALPLEGLEHFSLDGVRYEAFNTSGGLGTLCETLDGQVRELNYKTVRYLGHRHLMHFLVSELRLNEHREALKEILESAVPITYQDVVVTFCTVSGWRQGNLVQISDARKIYSDDQSHERWSAIQLTTAAGLCAVVDLHCEGILPDCGFVKQEDVNFEQFIENRFGRRYQSKVATRFSQGTGQVPAEDDVN